MSEKIMMLGNEAIARGAYEAGVKVSSAYPGTPSTEISECLAKYDEVYTEWAPNEKVAAEVAIGASIARPDTRVIHFTGDGSFHMNLNELCTAVSYNIPIISVIFNNSVLGMVHQWQGAFYGERYSSSEPNRVTDYKAVAEGFGGKGYRCETPAEFEAAMKEAMTMNGPVWIECVVDREEKVLPMIPGGKTVKDTIFN